MPSSDWQAVSEQRLIPFVAAYIDECRSWPQRRIRRRLGPGLTEPDPSGGAMRFDVVTLFPETVRPLSRKWA